MPENRSEEEIDQALADAGITHKGGGWYDVPGVDDPVQGEEEALEAHEANQGDATGSDEADQGSVTVQGDAAVVTSQGGTTTNITNQAEKLSESIKSEGKLDGLREGQAVQQPSYEEDDDGYVGVDPIYRNAANETEKPRPAQPDDEDE